MYFTFPFATKTSYLVPWPWSSFQYLRPVRRPRVRDVWVTGQRKFQWLGPGSARSMFRVNKGIYSCPLWTSSMTGKVGSGRPRYFFDISFGKYVFVTRGRVYVRRTFYLTLVPTVGGWPPPLPHGRESRRTQRTNLNDVTNPCDLMSSLFCTRSTNSRYPPVTTL